MTTAGVHQATGTVDIVQFLQPRPIADIAAAGRVSPGGVSRAPRRFLATPAITILAVAAAVVLSCGEVVDMWPSVPHGSSRPAAVSEFDRGERMSLPLSAGTRAVLGRWRVTTSAVEWSADDEVRRANAFPVDPAPGWHWALLDLSVLNRSAEQASASLLEVTLVSGALEIPASHAARQVPAQAIPNALDVIDVPAGASRTGTVGFVVPEGTAGRCVLRVDLRAADSATPSDSVWIACGLPPVGSREAR